MSESIEVSRVIPGTPEAIYKAWLSASEHGQMTGTTSTYNDDDSFTASDGYISGKTLEKEPFARILQSWRTTEFQDDDPSSTLEIFLRPEGEGTRVTLKHAGTPAGQSESYRQGWEDHYFDPMTKHFQSVRAKLNDMGHQINEVTEEMGEALEHAGEQVQKTAKQAVASVQKTAKKAQSAVQGFVARAKKQFASKKAAPKRKADSAKKAVSSAKRKASSAKKAVSSAKRKASSAKKTVKKVARKAASKVKKTAKKARR